MNTTNTHSNAPEHMLDFKPGLNYRMSVPKNGAWWGPRFLRHSLWLREIQGVLSNLCMLSGGSGSVVKGLAACAEEENRRAKNLAPLVKFGLIVLLGVLLLQAVFFSMGELVFLVVYGLLLAGILTLLWFLSYRSRKNYKGAVWVEPKYSFRDQIDRTVKFMVKKYIPWVVMYFLAGAVIGFPSIYFYNMNPLEVVAVIILGLFIVSLIFFFYVLIRSFAAARREAIYLKLRDDVLNGMTLAEAMGRMKRFFPCYYTDIAKVGEDSGQWQECMKDLSTHVQQYAYRYASIRLTMIYVFLSFTAQLGILIFLGFKVLPVFVEIHAEVGSQVPAISQALIDVMDVMYYNRYMLPVVFIAILLIVLISWLLPRRARSTRFPAGITLRIPLLKRLVVYQNVHLVSYILSRLLEAGVPLKDALATASKGDLHHAYRKSLLRIQEQTSEGTSISEAFENSTGLYTNSFCTFVRIGERSGMLPESLSQLSVRYGEERDRMSSYISSFVAPFFILILGAWTMFIMVGIFSAFFSLSDALMGTM